MDHYPSSNSVLIETLKLQKHPEGGYFAETDRQPANIPSPFAGEMTSDLMPYRDDTNKTDGQMANRGRWQRRSTTC